MINGRLVVLGQGYVGLPVAMRALDAGWTVVGYDTFEPRVRLLQGGRSPIEDIDDDVVRDALRDGRYRATGKPAELAGFEIAVICVPTPLSDGVPDVSLVETASRTLAPHVSPGCVVVLESTTYPGTTEEVVRPILEAAGGLVAGRDFHLGYSPERIDPGNREWHLGNTPKVVSGMTGACLERVDDFYSSFVDKTIPVSATRVAELVKLLENTFRHANIALVNEFTLFANDLGIDIRETIEAAATKPFGFMSFTPGPGVGGHCLPVDPSFLSWRSRQRLGRSFRFVDLANDINGYMPHHVVRRLTQILNTRGRPVNGSRLLLLGMSYKKNTGDARESPSRRIAEELLELGAHVRCADPYVADEGLPAGCVRVEATEAEASAADAVLVLVNHDLFAVQDLADVAALVLDCRFAVSGPTVQHL